MFSQVYGSKIDLQIYMYFPDLLPSPLSFFLLIERVDIVKGLSVLVVSHTFLKGKKSE